MKTMRVVGWYWARVAFQESWVRTSMFWGRFPCMWSSHDGEGCGGAGAPVAVGLFFLRDVLPPGGVHFQAIPEAVRVPEETIPKVFVSLADGEHHRSPRLLHGEVAWGVGQFKGAVPRTLTLSLTVRRVSLAGGSGSGRGSVPSTWSPGGG
jgi:hypothetical protein